MPFAWVIIVILWWAISAINKSRKNQTAKTKLQTEQEQSRLKTAQQYAKRQAQPQAAPQPATQPATPAMSRQDDWDDEEENWDQRVRPSIAPQPVQAAPVKRHETKPLETHMHIPAMGVEGEGTEGIDCCHEYMLDQPVEPPADFLPLQEQTEALRAKALLQGVIFSEILGRRQPRRYGTRRA